MWHKGGKKKTRLQRARTEFLGGSRHSAENIRDGPFNSAALRSFSWRHHLHTSYRMKTDGENQCHWDKRFIKVTLSFKLLKPPYLVSVAGNINLSMLSLRSGGGSGANPSAGRSGDGAASWLLQSQIMIIWIYFVFNSSPNYNSFHVFINRRRDVRRCCLSFVPLPPDNRRHYQYLLAHYSSCGDNSLIECL